LDNGIKKIIDEMKIAAAETLAGFLKEEELTVEKILPSVLDKNVGMTIAKRMADFKIV